MRTVKDQTIGDMFIWKNEKYRVVEFTSMNFVKGECVSADLPTIVVPFNKVKWHTKIKASTGNQTFSVPNNKEGLYFIDLLRIFKQKGIRISVRGRSKDRKDKNLSRQEVVHDKADWFSIYVDTKTNDDNRLSELHRKYDHNLTELIKTKNQLADVTEEMRRLVKLITEHNMKPFYKRGKINLS